MEKLEAPGGKKGNAVRYALGLLHLFGALNAFGGGYYGLSGAQGIPREWLEGSPFRGYFLPSLFLFVVVGGAFLAAGIAILARLRFARPLSLGTGGLVLAWIAVQVAIIGYVSWMQPATVAGGVLILLLTRMLPRPAR